MPGATPLPKRGDVFFDHRRPDRTLRLSPHPDAGVVVLSIWSGGVCQATFQLPGDQVELFAETLRTTSPPTTPPAPPATPPARRTPSPAPSAVLPAPSAAAPVTRDPAPVPDVFRTGERDTQPNLA